MAVVSASEVVTIMPRSFPSPVTTAPPEEPCCATTFPPRDKTSMLVSVNVYTPCMAPGAEDMNNVVCMLTPPKKPAGYAAIRTG